VQGDQKVRQNNHQDQKDQVLEEEALVMKVEILPVAMVALALQTTKYPQL